MWSVSSDRHIHDVLVGTQYLVADIESELKAKGRYLLADHDLAEVVFHDPYRFKLKKESQSRAFSILTYPFLKNS